MSTPTQQLLHKPAFKKLVVIIVTFIPAFLGLSIINVIFTHAVVLVSYFGGASTTSTTDGSSLSSAGDDSDTIAAAIPKRVNKQKRVKTVYVPPTQDDLQKILLELESSEPLPDNSNINQNNGESSMKRAQSAIASLQTLVEKKATGADTALKDVEELIEAYESFVTRFEEDLAHYHVNDVNTDKVLEHLSQFMMRKSLLDLDRDALDDLFKGIRADLNALAGDDVLLQNSNQALLKLFENDASSSSCDPSFLDLAQGNPTPELEVTVDAPQQTATSATKVKNDVIISEDTARESDLYERIDTIKEILSRRDLSSGDSKDPIDEEGVAEIRAKVSEMVLTLVNNQQDGFATTEEITQHLLKEASLPSIGSNPEEDNTDSTMCASPGMVEKLVQRGLDSIRTKADLQSALISTVFSVVAEESEDDEFQQIMGALDKVMSDVDVPRIDFSGKSYEDESKNVPPKSDKRKSLSYVVDGPLLHQGVAGSIDSFVELISGYNDYVDEFLDYIMNRHGASVGTAAADGISDLARKVPLPELEKLRQSGILGGRIRTLVEE